MTNEEKLNQIKKILYETRVEANRYFNFSSKGLTLDEKMKDTDKYASEISRKALTQIFVIITNEES